MCTQVAFVVAVGCRHAVEDVLGGSLIGVMSTFASIFYYRLDFFVSPAAAAAAVRGSALTSLFQFCRCPTMPRAPQVGKAREEAEKGFDPVVSTRGPMTSNSAPLDP